MTEPVSTSPDGRAGQETMLRQLQIAARAAGIGVWHVDLRSNDIATAQESGPISGLGPTGRPTTVEGFYAPSDGSPPKRMPRFR